MATYKAELQSFHLPLWQGGITLREGMRRLLAIGNLQSEVPFLVKMLENPAFDVPPLSMLTRRVRVAGPPASPVATAERMAVLAIVVSPS